MDQRWPTTASRAKAAGPALPGLGTGPVSYEDSISPEHYELERKAIFERTWLNVGRVEQLPGTGSYFTKEIDAARHVDHRRPRRRRRAPRVPQHLPPPRQQARVGGLPERGDERDVPAVHLQVPRVALRPRRRRWPSSSRRPSSSTSTSPSSAWCRCSVDVWEGFIFVNFDHEPTPCRCASTSAKFAAGLDGYPFGEMTQVYKYRADVKANWKLYIDAFAEFYHAPSCTRSSTTADESRKLIGLRLRGAALRARRPARRWCRRGVAWPRRRTESMVKPIERVLRSGNFGPWDKPGHRRARPAAARAQPGPPPGVGPRLVRLLPQLHDRGVGAGLVPHVPLLADRLQPAHLRGHAVLRPAARTPASACARSWPRSRSRSSGCRTATRSRRRRRCSSRGRSPTSRSTTRRSCSATSTRPPASTSPRTRSGRPARSAAPVRVASVGR